jgi:hypothetical protein
MEAFVVTILLRVRELKERRQEYEFCHRVSDMIDSFVMQVWRLYDGSSIAADSSASRTNCRGSSASGARTASTGVCPTSWTAAR